MNKILLLIGITAILLVSCKAKTSDSKEGERSATTDLIVNPEALIQMEIAVEGMTCTGCENTINSGVSQITGVIEVKSSFQEGMTIVKYDSTQTNIDKISQVITDKGYVVKGYNLQSGSVKEETELPETAN